MCRINYLQIIGLLFLLCFTSVKAQVPSYNMSNLTVTDCRGKFYDDGGPLNDYASVPPTGVSYTFQIFTGNPVITMTFNPAAAQTQITLGDNLTFYSQLPLIPANIIAGPYTNVPITGTIANVVSTTGSLIVVFNENGVIQGKGWDAGWFSTAPPPTPPTASISITPSCGDNYITLQTSEGVVCDSLTTNYFSITGPMFQGVTSVSAVPNSCSNGTTNVIQVYLNPGIIQNCNYSLNATLFRFDKCDSVHKFPNIINTFSINNCPIQASLSVQSTNTVCAYSCTASIAAVVPASVCLNIGYNWDNGLPATAGPHAICPTVTTVYNCTVSILASTVTPVVISQTMFVIDPQITPVATPTLCQSAPNFNLIGTPAGGVWAGPGIINTATGLYCPACTGAGVKTVSYTVGACTTTIQLTILAISAGNADAACIGAPIFTVTGGTPLGGTWSGNVNITPTGVFTPTALGTHTVMYSVGTCSAVKSVNVVNSITITPSVIPICQSVWYQYLYLNVQPFGGRFSGSPAILSNVWGTFSPSIVPPGPQVITYSLTGCSQTFTVDVLEINVSPSTATTCPTKAPFVAHSSATPLGGSWTCTNSAGSILNASTGQYNPAIFSTNSHTDVLVYSATNGCKDTLIMKAIKTNIVRDSLFFCANSNTFQLTNSFATFSYAPAGGVYTGPGVSLQGINYVFDPVVAGTGIHTVFYDINTCSDSIKIVVFPTSISPNTATVCSTHPTFVIAPPMLPGSNWVGSGIVTPSLGVFTPSLVAPGVYNLNYTNKGGCSNTATVTVYPFQAAAITNLNSTYCYINTNIGFTTVPAANGTLTAISSLTNGVFNPSVLGAGNYTLSYAFGVGACFTSTTLVVKVHPQLTTSYTITADTVCVGEASRLTVLGSGGLPTVSQYTYTWSDGLLPLNSHNVVPNASTIYTVITSDGCSDAVTNTFTVVVSPQYYPSYVSTPIQCYGETGQATLNINPTGAYSYTWSTTPVQSSSVVTGIAGRSYNVKIRSLTTGCIKDTTVKISGYNAIKALFIPNPNLTCVPFENNTITFIDQSNGAISGSWDFNGTIITYTPGQSVQHTYPTPGPYNAILNVVNEGNCPSQHSIPICILESTEIFIPDIFSPNKDGANDQLYVRCNGIVEMRFLIFDRWGTKVFESTNVNNGWDGTINGKNAEIGVYAYSLEATMVDDRKVIKKGDITIVR